MISCLTQKIAIIFLSFLLLSLVFFLEPAFCNDTTWHFFGNDLRNSGLTTGTGEMTTVLQEWKYEIPAALIDVKSSPALGDLVGDTGLEIAVGNEDGKLLILSPTGAKIAEETINDFGRIESAPALGDVNRDGDLEIVVADRVGQVVIAEIDNFITKSAEYNLPGPNNITSSPKLCNLDNDSPLEVIIGGPDDKLYVLSDTLATQWSYNIGGAHNSTPALGDLDGDGRTEIVMGSDTDTGKVYVFSDTGSVQWSFDVGYNIKSSPALGDVDGDGALEVVVGRTRGDTVYVLSDTGALQWSYFAGENFGDISTSPALGDLDDDGSMEIVVTRNSWDNNRVLALSDTGALEWSFKTEEGDNNVQPKIESTPALGDLDGDGKLEIIFGCDNKKLFVLSDTGAVEWSFTAVGEIKSSPALGDIDGDGFLEVVFGSDDNMIYALDYDGPAANFSYFPVAATAGETATFTAHSVDRGHQIVNRQWDFGDGNTRTGPDSSVEHSYSSPGIYQVELIVTNDRGATDAITKSFVVNNPLDWTMYGNGPLNNSLSEGQGEMTTGGITWEYATGGEVYSSPAVGDIDDDGEKEIVIGAGKDLDFGNSDTEIYVFSGSGNVEWSYPTGWNDDGAERYSSPALGDLNSDGSLEVIFGSADNSLYTFDGTGNKLWSFAINEPAEMCDDIHSPPVTGDIDSDTYLEIVFGFGDLGNNCADDGGIYVLSHDGDTQWRYFDEYPVITSPALGDIDADGDLEIAFLAESNIKVLEGNGDTTTWNAPSEVQVTSPVLKNIDADSPLEIIVGSQDGVLVLSDTGAIKWGFTPPDLSVESTPSVGDIDEDGYPEIVFGSDSSTVYALSHTGSEQWSYQTNGDIKSSPSLGDIDGDDQLEIVYGIYGWSDPRFQALEADGTFKWAVDVNPDSWVGRIYSSPALADIDADSSLEIVFGSLGGKVYALDYKPTADFGFAPANPVTGETVTFTDSSVPEVDSIVNWAWSFGDTTTHSGQDTTVEHSYTDSGTYQVHLSVRENDGAPDTRTKTIYVNNPLPETDFSWSPVNPAAGEAVTFTAQSSDSNGEVVNWAWDFGDSTSSDGSDSTPDHSYADTGTYLVQLVVADNHGGRDTMARNIDIGAGNASPAAGFTRSADTPRVGVSIQFNDTSTDPDGPATISNWAWNFGDGTTISGADSNPAHTYQAPGEYTVQLTVTDVQGGQDTARDSFVVVLPPTADFSYGPAEPAVNENINFTDESGDTDGNIVNWFWQFDDGDTSGLQNPQHSYGDSGNFQVRLVVTDDSGSADTKSKIVNVGDANEWPTAGFTYSPADPEVDELIDFSDNSTDDDGNVASWSWNFGDGDTGTQAQPSHTYDTTGVYQVELVVTDNEGGSDTVTKDVEISSVTSNNTSGGGGGGGGCLIEKTGLAPANLKHFRKLRDLFLKTTPGRWLVEIYYDWFSQ